MSAYNQNKADAFAEEMISLFNHSALSLMISIGHRLKIFDQLATMPPSSLETISEQTQLQARYLKEWLAALTMGKIIEYDSGNKTYFLPKEHAAFLTRAAAPNNFAVVAGFIPVFAQIEDHIIDCFRFGGGVPYSCYPGFQRVMAEESDQTIVSHLIDKILPLSDKLLEKLSQGASVADVGCGSGHAIITMASHFPRSQFIGFDLSEEAINNATIEAKYKNLNNAEFKIQDVNALKFQNHFDVITAFDAIHDQANPANVLKNIFNALSHDGIFLMQDIKMRSNLEENDNVMAPLIYTISCLHCMTVSLAQNGAGLGAAWGKEKALAMLEEAGFHSINVSELEHDIFNYYYIMQKS